MDEASYDVITMGRIGVDLYPLQTGVSLAKVTSFGKFLGGSPSNVAVAAARLGRRTAVITRTGRDPFGDYLRTELGEFGVDARWATPVDGLPTPVTFCEVFPPDDFPLYFYRLPKAPDLELREGELDLAAVRAARIFWVTGTGLCAEPSRSATLAALRARHELSPTPPLPETRRGLGAGGGPEVLGAVRPGAGGAGSVEGASGGEAAWGSAAGTRREAPGAEGDLGPTPPLPETRRGLGSGRSGHTVFDLDWRPVFWADPDDARPHYRAALAHATVAVGNLDECEVATGEREPRAAAEALLGAGVELAVVKQGPRGVLAVHRDGTVAEVAPVPVDVVNGLGAGDAFGGALCHGLLAGWELDRVMRYANAAGAIVASRLACSSAMPTPAEVERVLKGGRA
ncbi:5-dehydro-2-deoxygluconokinase [Streptomyces sp. NPDC006704]|uniref:5-dehydro-2-deoxygluconokinase n=1 Tax=Streptomyces sp. NPDC006704 TaxID=3364760 RepID=UPI0036765DA4